MKSRLEKARRIVVKIGSALVVGPDGAPDGAWLSDFAGDLARLRARGQQVLVVSSGAVALGYAQAPPRPVLVPVPVEAAHDPSGLDAVEPASEPAP